MPTRLSIHLDKQDGTFRPGEPIIGSVELVCPDARRLDELILALDWNVETPGEPHGVRAASLVLAKQVNIVANEPQTFRFELIAPPGPLTYHGHILSVHWLLRAEAKLGWKQRERAESRISLIAWTEEERSLSIRSYRLGRPQQSLVYNPGPLSEIVHEKNEESRGIEHPIVGIALAGATVALALLHANPYTRIFALLLLVGGLSTLFAHLPRRTLRRRLGPPQLDIHPEIVHAGGILTVTVAFRPPRPEVLSEMVFSLHATEVAARPSSEPDEPRFYRHSLHVERRVVDEARLRLDGARVTVIQEMFHLPESAPPSFGAPHNELRWEVTASVRTPDRLTWKQSRRILVFPSS
jgi:hypothetical protein